MGFSLLGGFAPRSGCRRSYCTAALAVLLVGLGAGPATAQTEPVPGEATFTIFIRGTDVGREQVNLARSGSQWIITSTGRLGDFTLNRFELKYAADWQPIELRVEGTQAGKPGQKDGQKTLQLSTSFALTTAINEITQNGVTNSKTDQISARTIVLPSNVFAGYEALAARLANASLGTELQTYVAANMEVKVSVKAISDEAVTTPAGIVKTRRYELVVHNVGATVSMTVAVDDRARLARLEMPSANLSVVRNDLAGVSARTLTAKNPTDSDVSIPANGFSIAGNDDQTADPWAAASPDRRARHRLGARRTGRHRCRHPDPEPARGRAGASTGFSYFVMTSGPWAKAAAEAKR